MKSNRLFAAAALFGAISFAGLAHNQSQVEPLLLAGRKASSRCLFCLI